MQIRLRRFDSDLGLQTETPWINDLRGFLLAEICNVFRNFWQALIFSLFIDVLRFRSEISARVSSKALVSLSRSAVASACIPTNLKIFARA
ncbi:hypothetical protein EMIT051CA3_20009 [Pseudomonas chlororaphis]